MASISTTAWTGRQFIDGRWIDGGEMLENRNPARFDEIIGRFRAAAETTRLGPSPPLARRFQAGGE